MLLPKLQDGFRRALVGAAVLSAVAANTAADPPRGSVAIDRIATIKHPTNPAWSRDGRMLAFLWDAAGKQDLFVMMPGGTPVALTRGDAPRSSSIGI